MLKCLKVKSTDVWNFYLSESSGGWIKGWVDGYTYMW